jgi:hypothetical protein
MDSVPVYIEAIVLMLFFILITLVTFAFLVWAVMDVGFETIQSRFAVFIVLVWGTLTATLAAQGFYQDTSSVPPRLFLFGVLPALLFIAVYFIFFRESFIERLSLKTLTLLHVVRIPVEFVLLWLSFAGQVPRVMTFEGRNFDILSGVLAPIVYLIAFRRGTVNWPVLIAYNILGLALLANIVVIAILSLPSPMQQMAFDQPNRAVLYFPYIWLPTIIVPIVLFSHLTSVYKLLVPKEAHGT